MNRTNMARQIEDPPMKKPAKKMARGGKVMMARGGKVKGKDDQSMCSPRKQMAMGKGK